MGNRVWWWRWRRNPLRGRTYLVEGWSLLATGVVAAAVAGFVGSAVAHDVQVRLARQRAERQPAAAVLTENAVAADSAVSQSRAEVRWTAPDGSAHTAVARVGEGLKRGARVTVWTDEHGELVPEPLSVSAARLEAAITGAAAAGGVGGVALAASAFAVRLADRRRADRWAAEWAVIGPQWTSKKA